MRDDRPAANPLSQPARTRGLVGIFVSTFFELSGYFMLLPLIAVTLAQRGEPAGVIGLFAASGWLGIFLATPFTAGWVDGLGKRNAFIVSAAVPVVAMAGIVLTDMLWLWALLYFLSGIASALRWIVGEATVAELAPEAKRGRIIGWFETMVGATFIIGPALLTLTGTSGRLPFLASLALLALGFALTFLLPALPHQATHDGRHIGLRGIVGAVKAAPVVMIAGFVGGFFESGITGLLPVFGLALGLSVAMATLLVSASGLGSTVMMVPVGELADRLPRRAVFIGCAALTLLGSVLLPATSGVPWLAWLIAFLWGGAGGSLYTLAMIEIGHRHKNTQLVSATSVLVMAYTAGGMAAPVAGGFALQLSPALGFPALMAGVALIGLIALIRGKG